MNQQTEIMVEDLKWWVKANLYKGVTLVMAAGFFLGWYDATLTGNTEELIVSSLFGALALPGMFLWISETRRAKLT